jgi:hypothetical protein
MAKRIEQSRKHGHQNPRRSSPLHVVSGSSMPLDEPAEPTGTPPTLTLVGGTDAPLDASTPVRN